MKPHWSQRTPVPKDGGGHEAAELGRSPWLPMSVDPSGRGIGCCGKPCAAGAMLSPWLRWARGLPSPLRWSRRTASTASFRVRMFLMRRRCRKADMPLVTIVRRGLLTRSFDLHSFRAGHRQVPITISPFMQKDTDRNPAKRAIAFCVFLLSRYSFIVASAAGGHRKGGRRAFGSFKPDPYNTRAHQRSDLQQNTWKKQHA